MVQSTDKDLSSVIESAMSRLPPGAPSDDDADPAGARTNLGRRDYDLALARRLAQLKTAMGEDLPTASTSPGEVPLARRTFGSGTLMATALVSALFGAALMWTMSAGSRPTTPTPAPIRTISAAPVAPSPAASAPVVSARSDEDLARERLESWRQAWSNRDSDAYLHQYSPDFTPADGQKHADWAAARRKNLASRSAISVQIRDLHIERLTDDRLQLVFLQDYVSGSYRETGQRKTLQLVRHDSGWLIAGEWQGGAPGN